MSAALSIAFTLAGAILITFLVVSILFLSSAFVIATAIVTLVWFGTLIYYLFFHQDQKPPRDDYSIGQGKEA